MAGRAARGWYGEKLLAFIESDEPGICPQDEWPKELAEKSASAQYQSFKSAAEKAKVADLLQLLQRDEKFYILHKERAGAVE
jgi:hypothetical protein